jgi:hypothetical protein
MGRAGRAEIAFQPGGKPLQTVEHLVGPADPSQPVPGRGRPDQVAGGLSGLGRVPEQPASRRVVPAGHRDPGSGL